MAAALNVCLDVAGAEALNVLFQHVALVLVVAVLERLFQLVHHALHKGGKVAVDQAHLR